LVINAEIREGLIARSSPRSTCWSARCRARRSCRRRRWFGREREKTHADHAALSADPLRSPRRSGGPSAICPAPPCL